MNNAPKSSRGFAAWREFWEKVAKLKLLHPHASAQELREMAEKQLREETRK